VPVGATLFAGGCQISSTYCFGSTIVQVVSNSTGLVVATSTRGPAGCGNCPYVNYTNLGLVSTRRRLFAVETQFYVRVNCTGTNATCGGVFAAQVQVPAAATSSSKPDTLMIVLISVGSAVGVGVLVLCVMNARLCVGKRKERRKGRRMYPRREQQEFSEQQQSKEPPPWPRNFQL